MTNTLLEVRHAIFAYFMQENAFNPKTHTQFIKFNCDEPQLKEAMVISVLKELEKTEMVRQIDSGSDTWFLLTKPLEMYEQSITLGYSTCVDIADMINAYCKSINNKKDVTEATSIKERDIQKLLLILDSLLPKESEQSNT